MSRDGDDRAEHTPRPRRRRRPGTRSSSATGSAGRVRASGSRPARTSTGPAATASQPSASSTGTQRHGTAPARGGADAGPRRRDAQLAPRRRHPGTAPQPAQQQAGSRPGEQAGDDQHEEVIASSRSCRHAPGAGTARHQGPAELWTAGPAWGQLRSQRAGTSGPVAAVTAQRATGSLSALDSGSRRSKHDPVARLLSPAATARGRPAPRYAVHRRGRRQCPVVAPVPEPGARHGVRPRSSRPLRGAARRQPDHAQARRATAGVGRHPRVGPRPPRRPDLGDRRPGEDPQPAPRPAGELPGRVTRPDRVGRRRGLRRAHPARRRTRTTPPSRRWSTSTAGSPASTRTGTEYRAAMVADRRVVLTLAFERVYGGIQGRYG